jgi:hypothetical protein
MFPALGKVGIYPWRAVRLPAMWSPKPTPGSAKEPKVPEWRLLLDFNVTRYDREKPVFGGPPIQLQERVFDAGQISRQRHLTVS